MNNITFSGVISHVGDIQSLTAKDGNLFYKREVLLQTVEEYPQTLMVELTNDRATEFCGIVGQTATAFLRFNTSESASRRTFNNIRCWRIDIEKDIRTAAPARY